AQGGRRFLQRVYQGGEEVAKLFVRPIEHIAGEQATAGAEFEDFDLRWTIERSPYLVKLPGQQASENGVNVARSIEVSGFAELFGVGGIVTLGGIVEADLHITRKRDGTVHADFLLDYFAGGQGLSFPLRQASNWAGQHAAAECG